MPNPRRCPICKQTLPQSEEAQKFRPFCSKRCADVDLSRWLTGSYAIPGKPEETEDEEEAGTPNKDLPVRH